MDILTHRSQFQGEKIKPLSLSFVQLEAESYKQPQKVNFTN
jgi:hypothetical protein